jgi:viroplasmin and RNaseH domain-containing protein
MKHLGTSKFTAYFNVNNSTDNSFNVKIRVINENKLKLYTLNENDKWDCFYKVPEIKLNKDNVLQSSKNLISNIFNTNDIELSSIDTNNI